MKIGVFGKILCVLMALCVVASTVFGIISFVGLRKLSNQVTQYITESNKEDDYAREDDIKICEMYEIKSTTAISDAYKSGKTDDLSDRDKETLSMAKTVIKSYITDKMTAYEKEYAIYDYLTNELKADASILTVIPQTDEGMDNPHDVLKYKSAVCVGYATTFRMFMQMLGIECMVVHSTDLTHTWNLVKLDNEWYHTDCYMGSEGGSILSFNMNDAICAQGHSWDMSFFPAATGMKYSPALQNVEELETIYDIPKWISEKLEESDGKSTTFSCKFKEGITEENEAVAEYIVSYVTNYIGDSDNLWASYIWIQDEDDNYVLVINIESYEDDYFDDYDIDEELMEKADEAINEYFDMSAYDYYDDYDYDYDYDYDDYDYDNENTVIGQAKG